MQMQANYQPLMIKTLLLSGDMATKDSIAMKIKEHNPDKHKEDFSHLPVYDVLESHGIVRRHNKDEYVLNIVHLTNEERQQLVALCNWRINNMPLQLEELIQAFDKNRNLFRSQTVCLQICRQIILSTKRENAKCGI
jgi:FlaA1/EpsC-like NDP-sugar epimerase